MDLLVAGLGARDLITSAGAIVMIATLAGMGYFRGTVTNLKEKVDGYQKDNGELRTQRDEARIDRDRYKADLDALTRVVTGEVHWVAIGEKIDEHNGRAEHHWRQDEALLKEIRDILLRGTPK